MMKEYSTPAVTGYHAAKRAIPAAIAAVASAFAAGAAATTAATLMKSDDIMETNRISLMPLPRCLEA